MAQSNSFDPSKSYSDIGFHGGIYTNIKGSTLNNGTTYSIDYGRFTYNGIGGRGGLSFINGLDNDICAIQIPLSFAWRTPISTHRKTLSETLGSVMYGIIQHPAPNFQNAFISLFSFRVELNAGFTPSYIIGHGYYNEHWNSSNETYYEGVLVDNHFGLSADISMRLSMRIWRFNAVVTPSYHYWLTNNFTAKSTKPISQPSKSYLSFNFGLSFAW